MQRVVPHLLPAPAQREAGLRGEGLQICVQPVRAHQAAEAGWPGVPAHIPQEGARGDNGGAGAPVPGGEGYCLAEEGQGVHCGGWGRAGDGEAAAEADGGAERQHQAMEGRGRV